MPSAGLAAWLQIGCAGCCQRVCPNRPDLWAVSVAQERRAEVPDWLFRLGRLFAPVHAALLGHAGGAQTAEPATAAAAAGLRGQQHGESESVLVLI